ncbi:MAG: serine/threonine-protein kinase, partial [Myxococcota bacterium]
MHHETDETQDVPGLHRDDEFLAPGATISRYLVLSTLGVGGMGIVYSAYDRSLDRKVAIKVLRSTADSALLLEEAKSMARVSHRNVVAIFDVGTVDGSVFLAMEHIDGVTLKDWIALAERSEAEIVQVMVAAGQGLAAAHQAGVIHRDFKPGNVIVGSDGRVVVTDFGIAHAVADAGAHSSKIGTPAYMAPETLKGALSDARSDQFSFAITLYEMLFGAHPFSRDNGEIARAIIAGELPDPPRDSRVSAPVQAATLRALAPEPEQRFPSVNSLLVELRKDPKAARRRGVGAALGAVGVAAVIGLFFIVGRDDPCGEYADRVSEVWNDTVRERIRGAFSNAALPFSDEAFTLTERALSRYASTWQAAQAASCRGEDPIAEASQELRILRAFCLEGRLKRFRSTVSLLEEANASEVEKAAGVVRAL